MLLLLLLLVLFSVLLGLCEVLKTLCVSSDDALLGDVLSSSQRNSVFLVASIFQIVAGIPCLVTNEIACPLPWCVLVAPCH